MIISGTYNLSQEDFWRLLQLQELYLECDTSIAPVTINLFPISDLERFWNIKIFVSDISNNASANPILIVSDLTDTINYSGSVSSAITTDGGRGELFVCSENQWGFVNVSPVIYTGYDQIQDEGTNLTQRTVIDFVGSGVTASDSGSKTIVTIPGIGGTSVFGSFYDTTNQTGNSGSVLTMSLNTSDPWNNNVSIVSGTQITVTDPAVYNLAFSAQMVKISGNSATHAHIWLAQNGFPVSHSASQISFPANSVYMVAAWNFFFKTTLPNEYVELKWLISSNVNNAVRLETQPVSGSIPEVPCLIVTVNKVN